MTLAIPTPRRVVRSSSRHVGDPSGVRNHCVRFRARARGEAHHARPALDATTRPRPAPDYDNALQAGQPCTATTIPGTDCCFPHRSEREVGARRDACCSSLAGARGDAIATPAYPSEAGGSSTLAPPPRGSPSTGRCVGAIGKRRLPRAACEPAPRHRAGLGFPRRRANFPAVAAPVGKDGEDVLAVRREAGHDVGVLRTSGERRVDRPTRGEVPQADLAVLARGDERPPGGARVDARDPAGVGQEGRTVGRQLRVEKTRTWPSPLPASSRLRSRENTAQPIACRSCASCSTAIRT